MHEFATSTCAECGVAVTAKSIWAKLPPEMRKELLETRQLQRKEGIYCATCKQRLFPSKTKYKRKTRAEQRAAYEAKAGLPPGKWVVRKGVRHFVKESV